MSAGAQNVPRLGFDWQVRADTGWGVYGLNLALQLARRGSPAPVPFDLAARDLPAAALERLRPALREGGALARRLAGDARATVPLDGVMLHGLGNNFAHSAIWGRVKARARAGVVFFEHDAFDRAGLERVRSLARLIAGSSWNAERLRGRGVAEVRTVLQGVDPELFHPGPRAGRFGGRFVVFSGGKLEYRKGQDLVVAAFKRFRDRHPEALLVAAWHSPYPQSLEPRAWLAAQGLAAEAVHDAGRVPNAQMAELLREADVALLPSRCEGGTNLVAMECMACGVPTIVSANTGHLDLVATGGCIALERQGEVRAPEEPPLARQGWGESDVEEMVEALERVHAGRAAAQALAARGAAALAAMSWDAQIGRLLEAIGDLF